MAGDVLNIKVCSPLKQLSGLTGNYYAICHYSYNLPLHVIKRIMKLHEVHLKISKYLSRFKEQIKILNANSEFSINVHAENAMINVLNLIYDCDFQNLNYSEDRNYDSIDLGDKSFKLSIQVTATKKITKIKESLEKYIENGHYEKYTGIKFLILTGRQEKYSTKAVNQIINGKFEFDINKDVIDLSTVYVKLNEINDLQKSLAILELLKAQFSDIHIPEQPVNQIETFDELKKLICKKLKKTNKIFLDFGPNSGANSSGPVRWDLTLWYEARREKILPINNFVVATLQNHMSIIPEKCQEVVSRYLNHVFAFNKHVEDSNFDYSEYQFPKEINEVFCG